MNENSSKATKEAALITDELATRISNRLWEWHKAWRYAYHLSPDVLKAILNEELGRMEQALHGEGTQGCWDRDQWLRRTKDR